MTPSRPIAQKENDMPYVKETIILILFFFFYLISTLAKVLETRVREEDLRWDKDTYLKSEEGSWLSENCHDLPLESNNPVLY